MYQTVNGPKTVAQMRDELRVAGYPNWQAAGEAEIAQVYARTSRGNVSPIGGSAAPGGGALATTGGDPFAGFGSWLRQGNNALIAVGGLGLVLLLKRR